MVKRIGLTMRVASAGYGELRDCLAQDWAAWMAAALPEVAWLPIPNLGEAVEAFVRNWQLDGCILTGGNDVGENALRDLTESILLSLSLSNGLPVFGVCRGLQMMQKFFGGELGVTERAVHVASEHEVMFTQSIGDSLAGSTRKVNSYHNQAVSVGQVARPLQAFAVSSDGWAEGLFHPQAPLAAVQWHPERTQAPDPADVALIRTILLATRR